MKWVLAEDHNDFIRTIDEGDAVYDQWQFIDERREALDKWATLLGSIRDAARAAGVGSVKGCRLPTNWAPPKENVTRVASHAFPNANGLALISRNVPQPRLAEYRRGVQQAWHAVMIALKHGILDV